MTLCHQSFLKTAKSCPIPHQIPATKYETQGCPQSHLSISCMPGFIPSYTSFHSFCSWRSIFHCDIFWFVFVFALNFLFLKSTCDKESAYQCKRQRFDPWVGRSPRQGNGNPVFLPGKFHGQRSWQATVHGVAKSWTQLSDQNNNWWCIFWPLDSEFRR